MNRTNRITTLALAGLSLLVVSIGLNLLPAGGRAVAATQTVAVRNNQFSPAALTISAGDTVQWDWPVAPNAVPHTVTSDFPDTELGSPQQAQGSYSHTFATAGTFNYHCEVHPNSMAGTITVQAPEPTATSTSTAAATNTVAPAPTRTATPVATGTAVASATPVITPTHTSGIAPTVIAPAPPPVAPPPSGGVAGADRLPRAGTGGAADRLPLRWVSVALAAAGLLAFCGAAAMRRRA
jgi:plastocyanin